MRGGNPILTLVIIEHIIVLLTWLKKLMNKGKIDFKLVINTFNSIKYLYETNLSSKRT